jgi:hypothetical protein
MFFRLPTHGAHNVHFNIHEISIMTADKIDLVVHDLKFSHQYILQNASGQNVTLPMEQK